MSVNETDRIFERDRFILDIPIINEKEPINDEPIYILDEDGAGLFTITGDIRTCRILELRDSANITRLRINYQRNEARKKTSSSLDSFNIWDCDIDKQLGWIKKNSSDTWAMFRDKWTIFDKNGREIARAHKTLILKKFWRNPLRNGLFRTQAADPEYLLKIEGKIIGTLTSTDFLMYQCKLDLTKDIHRKCNRRLALSLAVLLVFTQYRRELGTIEVPMSY